MSLTWTLQDAGFGSGQINSVHWSEEQQLWVAVGSVNRIVTSPDGVTWTPRVSNIPNAFVLVSVHYSPLLNQWLVVDGSWGVATSPDAITWTFQAGFPGASARNAWWSEQNSLWVVAHQSSLVFGASPNGGGASTSPDGVTWTRRNTQTGARQPFDVTYSIAQNRWMIVGDSDINVRGISYSTNGGTGWFQITTFPLSQPNLRGVGYSESLGMWLLAGSSGAWRTTDLLNWTSVVSALTLPGGSLNGFFSIKFWNGLWFLTARYFITGNNHGIVWTSADGITWNLETTNQPVIASDTNVTFSGYSPSLNQWIIVGGLGFIATGRVLPTLASFAWKEGE